MNELEEERGVALAHARHVDDVERGPRGRRVSDHLLQRRDASAGGGVLTAFAQVNETGHAVARRDPEQTQDFLAAGTRRVRDAESDGERALREPPFCQGIKSGQVCVGQRTIRPGTTRVIDNGDSRQGLVVRHQRPSRARVADADAVVDEGMALPLGVPGRDRIRPDL